MTTVAEFVQHYGTKGMKWGVRKAAPAPIKPSTDYKKSRELKAKHPATLSTKQLKTLNERMQLEQKYSQMNPGKVKRGEAKVKDVLAVLGTGVLAYNLLTSNAAKATMARGQQVVRAAAGKRVVRVSQGQFVFP